METLLSQVCEWLMFTCSCVVVHSGSAESVVSLWVPEIRISALVFLLCTIYN